MSSILFDSMQMSGIFEGCDDNPKQLCIPSASQLIPPCTQTLPDYDNDWMRFADSLVEDNHELINSQEGILPTTNTLQKDCLYDLTTIENRHKSIPVQSLCTPIANKKTTSDEREQNKGRKEKPIESYIQMIATVILESCDKRLLLSQIYEKIHEHWQKFDMEGSTWKNSVRHNLSTNECFRKNGRAPTGRGYYWSIHPACIVMFKRGDFRRREAKRRVKLMQQKMSSSEPTSKKIQHSTSDYNHPVQMRTYPTMSTYQTIPHQQVSYTQPYQLPSTMYNQPLPMTSNITPSMTSSLQNSSYFMTPHPQIYNNIHYSHQFFQDYTR